MITSNGGLCELPHLAAPISFFYLAQQMQKVLIPAVSCVPIWFIHGVKNRKLAGEKAFSEMDMMRGEETEAAGYFFTSAPEDTLLLLPGSHMKMVVLGREEAYEGR